ncbi:PDZ domain-containing protein [Planctomycetota bacterium]
MNIDKKTAGKNPKRYYWLAFVIGGMVIGFLGCLVYSYVTRADHVLLSDAAGNPKTDKPIVQTALTIAEAVSSSAFLGVEVISVDAVIAQQLSLSSVCGVIVNSVVEDSPADKAGLQRSDCLLSLNSITIDDTDGFREIMATLKAGDNVKIAYIRDGDKDTVYAKLASSSVVMANVSGEDDSQWGLSLAVLSSDLRTSLRIPTDIEGVVILSVKPGGTADEAGLQAGDVIVGINNKAITNMGDFFDALTADEDGTVLLDIYSQGTLRFVALDSAGVIDSVAQAPISLLDRMLSVFIDDDKVVLVSEHENEEDDYEKPVCKRLEESGERYEDED